MKYNGWQSLPEYCFLPTFLSDTRIEALGKPMRSSGVVTKGENLANVLFIVANNLLIGKYLRSFSLKLKDKETSIKEQSLFKKNS